MSFREAARLIAADTNPSLLPIIDEVCDGLLSTPESTPAGAPPSRRTTELRLLNRDSSLRQLVDDLNRPRDTGTSPANRRRLLLADHSIAACNAWLFALHEIDVPGILRELPVETQVEAAEGGRVALTVGERAVITRLVGLDLPDVGPHRMWPEIRTSVETYYQLVFDAIATFLRGIRTDRQSVGPVHAYANRVESARVGAIQRYWRAFAEMAGANRELAFWADLRSAAADEKLAVSDLPAALAEIDDLLSTGGLALRGLAALARRFDPPPETDPSEIAELIRFCQGDFHRNVIDPTEHAISPDLTLPALSDAYVNPQCRTVSYSSDARPFDHEWWVADTLLRDDMESFLFGYLTFPSAFERPLVVLGDPGAGKSVFVRGLAAALTNGAWLPIVVRLRHAPANGSVLAQVESALHAALKRPSSWAELVNSARGRTPVLLLDGFDELLQTTSTSRADFLEEVRLFQESEATAGRRVAVVVTTRTAVAHRARIPSNSFVVRIEPFDRARAHAWLLRWNLTIGGYLSRKGLVPLGIDAVWKHEELASQPLLLLLLAIHDTVNNEFQHSGGAISQGDLYERLLGNFVEREMRKRYPAEPSENLRQRVELELDSLSFTSFAMFNRSRQSVAERELDADLLLLTNPEQRSTDDGTADPARLTPAQLLLGRFFFIHESMSTHEAAAGESDRAYVELRTYEFLHSTFGEYLIARFLAKAVRGLGFGPGRSDEALLRADGRLLHALLSFRPFTGRGKILEFALEQFGKHGADRGVLVSALARLLQEALHNPMPSAYVGYAPAPTNVVQRLACYSLNLVSLIAAIGPPLTDVRSVFPAEPDPIEEWRRLTLIWRAGMDDGAWRSVLDELAAARTSPDQLYFGLADRLLPADGSLIDLDLARRLRDAPEPLTPHEAPAIRQLLKPFWEIKSSPILAHTVNGANPAATILGLTGSADRLGSANDGSAPCDADYLACISTAHDLPPGDRRIFIAAIAYEFANERRVVRNRSLIDALLRLGTADNVAEEKATQVSKDSDGAARELSDRRRAS